MKFLAAFLLIGSSAFADAPVIENAVVTQNSDGTWRFEVTVSHPDTGWDHYADGWQVEDQTGNVLGLRILAHPHETEQPFTRALTGIALPAGAQNVNIRARCIVDGWSDQIFSVSIE